MRVLYPSVKFARPELRDELLSVDERLIFIVEDCARWVDQQGYDFILTSVLSDEEKDARLGRVSKSHQEGRAVDVRTRDWDEAFIQKFLIFINAAHGHHGAISKSDGKRRVAVYHNNGNGAHLHLQVSRRK